jgi:hypothetical protein
MNVNRSALVFFIVFSLFPGAAEEINVSASKTVDWEEGIITLEITAATDTAWTTPSSRYDMDRLISKRAPVFTAETLSDIPLSSLDTIGSAILKDTALYGDLLKLPDRVGKTFSTASEDRKSLTVQYNIPLFPHIASLFMDRKKADTIDVDLRYTATADFTGLIIYAAEELPLHGTNKKAVLRPSIFPRIFDENLNLVLDMTRVDPEFLQKWGTSGFSLDENREYYGDRVGAFPLRTMATALFGKNETDLIIPESAVRKILSTEHNRELLAQGRVMIIYGESK